ncbi:hypothetical protein BKA62DRAFT_353300 [Auriculariales sp. MPI-PUGE-AT-0066]|nr:hypothetical protein BKA62DRAFT_353300 [Auriculariales sp. MPI-PUGE-AT-0066]
MHDFLRSRPICCIARTFILKPPIKPSCPHPPISLVLSLFSLSLSPCPSTHLCTFPIFFLRFPRLSSRLVESTLLRLHARAASFCFGPRIHSHPARPYIHPYTHTLRTRTSLVTFRFFFSHLFASSSSILYYRVFLLCVSLLNIKRSLLFPVQSYLVFDRLSGMWEKLEADKIEAARRDPTAAYFCVCV